MQPSKFISTWLAVGRTAASSLIGLGRLDSSRPHAHRMPQPHAVRFGRHAATDPATAGWLTGPWLTAAWLTAPGSPRPGSSPPASPPLAHGRLARRSWLATASLIAAWLTAPGSPRPGSRPPSSPPLAHCRLACRSPRPHSSPPGSSGRLTGRIIKHHHTRHTPSKVNSLSTDQLTDQTGST